MKRRSRQYHCEVAGCGAARRYSDAVCRGCWAKLPADQRRAIIRARVDGHIGHWSALVMTARRWIEARSPAAIAARRIGERQ